jgi:hypothetical protein
VSGALSNLEAKILELEETAEVISELVREAHAATKDLRSAIRDANEVLSSTPVMSRIDEQVALGLERYKDEIKRAQAEAVDQVGRTFETLCNVHLYGNEAGTGKSVFEEMADRAREFHRP